MNRSVRYMLAASTVLVLAIIRATGASSGTESAVNATPAVTLLESTLGPLVDQFNKDSDKPRVLALLSPT